MKLGIAYNIFNGDELLLDSLKRLRSVSDYTVLTYQNISNTGNESPKDILEILLQIDNSLYDEIVLFEPSSKLKPAKNETQKRNLGLTYAKKNGCTHFMSIDCDEFYDLDQFRKAKAKIMKHGYKSTACELVNYFHSSKYQIIAHKQYVPFIFKISRFKKHKFKRKLPVTVDPTRVITNQAFHCFHGDELMMHHMSYVRDSYASLESKLLNSPNRALFMDSIPSYLTYFDQWTPEQPALNPHEFKKGEKNHVKIIKTPILLSVTYTKNVEDA